MTVADFQKWDNVDTTTTHLGFCDKDDCHGGW